MLKLSSENVSKNDSKERMKFYSEIETQFGKETAYKWSENEFRGKYSKIKFNNDNYLKEILTKYEKYLAVPEIEVALSQYIGKDIDLNSCLKEQGLSNAFVHLVNIYMNGYNSVQGVKIRMKMQNHEW
ncbi:MAG: hypothetical protein WCK67_12980 [bacterium]